MGGEQHRPPTSTEQEALHSLTLGREWIHRAYGSLLAFHHNTGHAMDHFATAERLLREAGHTELADTIRDQHLPRGVVEDRWSYQLVECFEDDLLADVDHFEATVREQLADGERHVTEQALQREWRDRAEIE